MAGVKALGFTYQELADAIAGPIDEFEAFKAAFQDAQRAGGTLIIPIVLLDDARRKVREAQISIAEDILEAQRRGVSEEIAEKMARQDKLTTIPVEYEVEPLFSAPVDDSAVIGALDDYRNNIAGAFADISESVTDHLDFWYEFPEKLDAAIAEALGSYDRQLTAVRNFNSAVAEIDLTPSEESLLRSLINTPALMEQFTTQTDQLRNHQIAEIKRLRRETQDAVMEEYGREAAKVEFVSGNQFVMDLSTIAQDMFADPENVFTLAEIWSGLIDASMDNAAPAMREKILASMLWAFTDDGRLKDNIDFTTEMVDSLIAKLLELQGNYEVTVSFGLVGRIPGAGVFPGIDPTPSTPTSTAGPADYQPISGPRRASGGYALANKPYITSELGPELFVPYSSGNIIPSKDLGGGGDRSTIVNVYRVESDDLPGDISEGLTRASVNEQVELIGAY